MSDLNKSQAWFAVDARDRGNGEGSEGLDGEGSEGKGEAEGEALPDSTEATVVWDDSDRARRLKTSATLLFFP